MAYDERLAQRIRELMAGEPELSEKRMFGGLAFLVGGGIAVAAASGGGIMVRVDPEQAPALIASGAADPMQMRGRPMRGWVRVGPEPLADREALAGWVARGVARARSLPSG